MNEIQRNELPSIQGIASLEYGQCSIASAELNRRVHGLLDNPEMTAQRTLLMVGELNDGTPHDYDVTPVSEKLDTVSGRQVELALINRTGEEPRYQLAAITRGDVVLPLASFVSREDGTECDYVQIGQEMTDESFIFTPKDERSRKDIIEAMRELLDADPRQFLYAPMFAEAKDASSNLTKGVTDVFKKGESKTGIFSAHIDKHSAQAIKAYGFLEATDYLNSSHYNTEDGFKIGWFKGASSISKREKRAGEKWIGIFNEFLENPSLKSIADGSAPGCDIPEVKIAMIHKVWNQLDFTDSSAQAASAVTKLLEIDNQLEELLGKAHLPTEKALGYLGQLSLQPQPLTFTQENFVVDRTKCDMDFTVDIKRQEADDAVSVTIRPSALAKRETQQAMQVYLNRTNYVEELEDEEASKIGELEWTLRALIAHRHVKTS